jgi:hypothetical protein
MTAAAKERMAATFILVVVGLLRVGRGEVEVDSNWMNY